mmetsp:Transcript_2864/g.6367  ORF Transcript_2864/g.6367 Transcript_2864/m.6367 type:complete len:431 (+) Transcript_2864:292-1584(+)
MSLRPSLGYLVIVIALVRPALLRRQIANAVLLLHLLRLVLAELPLVVLHDAVHALLQIIQEPNEELVLQYRLRLFQIVLRELSCHPVGEEATHPVVLDAIPLRVILNRHGGIQIPHLLNAMPVHGRGPLDRIPQQYERPALMLQIEQRRALVKVRRHHHIRQRRLGQSQIHRPLYPRNRRGVHVNILALGHVQHGQLGIGTVSVPHAHLGTLDELEALSDDGLHGGTSRARDVEEVGRVGRTNGIGDVGEVFQREEEFVFGVVLLLDGRRDLVLVFVGGGVASRGSRCASAGSGHQRPRSLAAVSQVFGISVHLVPAPPQPRSVATSAYSQEYRPRPSRIVHSDGHHEQHPQYEHGTSLLLRFQLLAFQFLQSPCRGGGTAILHARWARSGRGHIRIRIVIGSPIAVVVGFAEGGGGGEPWSFGILLSHG